MIIDDILAERSMDHSQVKAHKAWMLAETRVYRFRELRGNAGLTQAQLAERIGVGQRQISKIEHGDLDTTKIGTTRRYLEVTDGSLLLEYVAGNLKVVINREFGSIFVLSRCTSV